MYWVELTQANTGVKVYINMELVVLVAPSRRGGSNLMLQVREPSAKSGKDSARIIPVVETPAEVMSLVQVKRNA